MIAINEAIDQGVPEGTLAAMQNPNAMLLNLDSDSAQKYHDTLYRAKGEKVASSRKRVRSWRKAFLAWLKLLHRINFAAYNTYYDKHDKQFYILIEIKVV